MGVAQTTANGNLYVYNDLFSGEPVVVTPEDVLRKNWILKVNYRPCITGDTVRCEGCRNRRYEYKCRSLGAISGGSATNIQWDYVCDAFRPRPTHARKPRKKKPRHALDT